MNKLPDSIIKTNICLLCVCLLAIMLNYLRSHERQRSRESLRSRRQHDTTDPVVSQSDVDGHTRLRPHPRLLAAVRGGKGPHQNVLRLNVAVDDLPRVKVLQSRCNLQIVSSHHHNHLCLNHHLHFQSIIPVGLQFTLQACLCLHRFDHFLRKLNFYQNQNVVYRPFRCQETAPGTPQISSMSQSTFCCWMPFLANYSSFAQCKLQRFRKQT